MLKFIGYTNSDLESMGDVGDLNSIDRSSNNDFTL